MHPVVSTQLGRGAAGAATDQVQRRKLLCTEPGSVQPLPECPQGKTRPQWAGGSGPHSEQSRSITGWRHWGLPCTPGFSQWGAFHHHPSSHHQMREVRPGKGVPPATGSVPARPPCTSVTGEDGTQGVKSGLSPLCGFSVALHVLQDSR